MKKYKIAHYQKSGSMWYTNGGNLIVTEKEYIVKYLFQTVAHFDIEKTIAKRIVNNVFHKGLSLSDGQKSIDLYFFPKTAELLFQQFNI